MTEKTPEFKEKYEDIERLFELGLIEWNQFVSEKFLLDREAGRIDELTGTVIRSVDPELHQKILSSCKLLNGTQYWIRLNLRLTFMFGGTEIKRDLIGLIHDDETLDKISRLFSSTV